MKANKAPKEEVDRAVGALLDIKKRLKLAGGDTDAGGKKDEKKKKGDGDKANKSSNSPQKT